MVKTMSLRRYLGRDATVPSPLALVADQRHYPCHLAVSHVLDLELSSSTRTTSVARESERRRGHGRRPPRSGIVLPPARHPIRSRSRRSRTPARDRAAESVKQVADSLHVLLRHRLRSIAQGRGRGRLWRSVRAEGVGGVGGQNFRWWPRRSKASQILVKTTKTTQCPWFLKPNASDRRSCIEPSSSEQSGEVARRPPRRGPLPESDRKKTQTSRPGRTSSRRWCFRSQT